MTFRPAYLLSTLINLILFLFITYCSAAPTSTNILEKRKGGGGGGRGGRRTGLVTGVAMAGLVGIGLCCYAFICCTRCIPCGGRKKKADEADLVEEAKLDAVTPDNESGGINGEKNSGGEGFDIPINNACQHIRQDNGGQ